MVTLKSPPAKCEAKDCLAGKNNVGVKNIKSENFFNHLILIIIIKVLQ